MRRDPFTWPREECPVESASLVLRLKDGRRVEYAVSEPDAARLLCDYAPGRYPGDDDILYGNLPIVPDPRVTEPRPPLQFTVTFGFRLMRRDEFLRVAETPAEEAARDQG
jgi:hypothetical protein